MKVILSILFLITFILGNQQEEIINREFIPSGRLDGMVNPDTQNLKLIQLNLRNDSLYQYMIYLPEIKMVNRFVSRHDRENFSENKFRIFTFIDETQLKQKIRVELIVKE